MINKENLVTSAIKIGATSGGLVAAVHAPLLATCVLGSALLLITVVALVAALSRRKARRDAAYKVLHLLLHTLRRQSLGSEADKTDVGPSSTPT